MGTVERRQYSIMRAFLVVFLAVAVSAEADPYTLGQVAAGATNGGVVTGVDYGHGVVAGVYGAGVYGAGVHTYGKREAEPYTLAQVRLGLTHGGVVTNPAVVHAPYAHVGYPYTGASVYGAVSPFTGVYGVPAVPAVTYAAAPAVTYAGVPAVAGSAVHSGTTNKLFGHAV